jgi:hypothetical protein
MIINDWFELAYIRPHKLRAQGNDVEVLSRHIQGSEIELLEHGPGMMTN